MSSPTRKPTFHRLVGFRKHLSFSEEPGSGNEHARRLYFFFYSTRIARCRNGEGTPTGDYEDPMPLAHLLSQNCQKALLQRAVLLTLYGTKQAVVELSAGGVEIEVRMRTA